MGSTARIAGKLSRADLGLRPPRSRSLNIHPAKGGCTLHWGGAGSRIDDHGDCERIWKAWQDFHMDTRGWVDIAYCVDEQTEILTQDGWRGYRDLRAGDIALTLEHDTGMAQWQPVLEVCIFPAVEREMVSMESSTHSSLTTPNHRWPVVRPHRRTGAERLHGPDGQFVASGKVRGRYLPAEGQDRRWVTSETFGYWDRVPIAAECTDLPVEPKYEDALVEVLAWFWTEGTVLPLRDGSASSNVSISQSHVVNEGNCERIRGALTRLFGPQVTQMPRAGRTTDGIPRWREIRRDRKLEFWLSADAGRLVQSLAPGRVPTFEFLRALTRAQLALFIEVSMLADNSGPRNLAQKNRAAAEAFQFACILAGMATSLRPRPSTASCPSVMWDVRFKKRRTFQPYRLSQGTAVTYDGEVWCPRTANQTWLARRNGTVYFTGNTMGFCQHGWVFAGRGYGVRTAGQGTNLGNDISYAFCHINEVGRGPTQAALDAATWLVADARAHGGAGKRVWPHWYWHPTGCPGYELTAHAAYLDKRAIVLPSAMIKNSIQGDDDMPSLQDIQQGLLYYPTLDLDKKTKINVITEISRSYEGVSRLEREMQELRDQVAELVGVITDRLPAPSSSSK